MPEPGVDTVTPEEIDAAWAQRHTDNQTTLIMIANVHLDAINLDDNDGTAGDDYMYLFRATWAIHKLELLQYQARTWPPRRVNLGAPETHVAYAQNAPRRLCGHSLGHPPHLWEFRYLDKPNEAFWCGGDQS
jgi:hypothetical protein